VDWTEYRINSAAIRRIARKIQQVFEDEVNGLKVSDMDISVEEEEEED
jgi:hypothetical protein